MPASVGCRAIGKRVLATVVCLVLVLAAACAPPQPAAAVLAAAQPAGAISRAAAMAAANERMRAEAAVAQRAADAGAEAMASHQHGQRTDAHSSSGGARVVMARSACLTPGDPVRGHAVVAGGAGAAFCVDQLLPLSRYEARVSYPASNPAAMSVSVERWSPGPTAIGATGTRGAARRLLNAEKAVFDTDERGVPVVDGGVAGSGDDGDGGGAVVVVVRAAPEGVRPGTGSAAQSAAAHPGAPVPFSVIVEVLHAGAVPHTAVRMGVVLAASALLLMFGIVPYLTSARSPWGEANVERRRRLHEQ